jgi:hypothetical protein
MENVLRREMVFGLKDLFTGANIAGDFMEWFKGFKGLKESKKADEVGKLVDNARSSLNLFQSCNAIYNAKELNVTVFDIPTVSQGKTFTHGDTIKNIEFLDFTALIGWCAMESIDLRYIDYKAYLEFDEEIHDEEEYFDEKFKYAFKEEEKYSVLENLINMSFDDIENHFISFCEEDIDGSRSFLKLDNGIEIVIDKLG